MHAFRNEEKKDEGYEIDDVFLFFEETMRKWAGDMQG